MTKLDWRKAKARLADPARQQVTEDFVQPDSVVISSTPISHKVMAKHLAKQSKERKREAWRWPSRISAEAREAEKLADEAAREKRRKALLEARKLKLARKKGARKARESSTENIERRAERSRLAEIDRKANEVLKLDREPLRRRWRRLLLGE
jgi:hypothetical protein